MDRARLGPQLVWRPDDRLEVTMLRLTGPPGPAFLPGWQKVVDVRTGVVEAVPADEVPSTPARETQPTVSPDGREVTFTSQDGSIEVLLRDASGTRTLLAADDGRILVIRTVGTPLTRVLTDESTMGGSGGDPRVAVTAADLLASPG